MSLNNVIPFVGKKQEVERKHSTRRLEGVNPHVEERKRRKREREEEAKKRKEAGPQKKWTQKEIDLLVMSLFSSQEQVTLRQVKRESDNLANTTADNLIRNSLKRLGEVKLKYPEHSYVLKDEFKMLKHSDEKDHEKQASEEWE